MTGHFQQISGLSKSLMFKGGFESIEYFISAVKIFSEQVSLVLQPRIFTIIPVILICYFMFLCIQKREQLYFLKDFKIVLILAFSIFEVFYYFVSYGKYIRGWHAALAGIVLQLLFVYACKAAYDYNNKRKIIKKVLIICFLIIGANCFFNAPYYLYKFPQPRSSHIAAKWLNENLPQDCTIGVWDAGVIGYFSERKVVNLDGLINGIELYQYRKDGRGVMQYIIDKKLDYVGNNFSGEPYLLNSILAPGLELVYKVTDNYENKPEGKEKTWYLWKIDYDKLGNGVIGEGK
jgi:hypothetical protein